MANARVVDEVEGASEDELRALVRKLEGRVAELDARNLELEKLAARRGVKLSCANIALSRAKIAFDEAADRREAMVQQVAHDLRTPLTSIKGASQNLLDGVAGPLSDDAAEYVEIMHQHSDRLIQIVNWLVDAIRISAEAVELQTERTDVAELVCEVVRSLKPIADRRGITLDSEKGVATAVVDRARLRQIVENLVGNALKHTPEGGRARVSVGTVDDMAEIRVTDTGCGMSEQELERAFDRYYQGSRDRGGTGLGLAISREYVRLHGGEIMGTSTPDEGSEFVVTLPAEP